VPVFALTPDEAVARRLTLCWGVNPLVSPLGRNADAMIRAGENILLKHTSLKPGDRVVMLHGTTPFAGGTNLVKVHTLGEKEKGKK
jgi:pyruvate kinase